MVLHVAIYAAVTWEFPSKGLIKSSFSNSLPFIYPISLSYEWDYRGDSKVCGKKQ